MWVRKRIDIGWLDLAFGIRKSLWSKSRAAVRADLEAHWSPDGDALACLSIRTGFDLLWKVLQLPPHSEILMSAVTIGDMVKIVEEHGLVPVPVDLDVSQLAPRLDAIRRAITPKTKAIVVAHLFGSRVPMAPILEIAREHGLLVIEDCAQAFEGDGYRGHPDTDVAMFSFGPIKTATALGGAIFRVRDGKLLADMRGAYDGYPVQSRFSYFRRLLKYGVIKIMSTRWFLGSVARGCRLFGGDHDGLSNRIARGFAGPGFFDRIRKQPNATLLAMMQRRITQRVEQRTQLRASRGRLLIELLNGSVTRPGAEAGHHSHWVFPIMVDEPRQLMEKLWRAGFDATQGQSHCVIEPPQDRHDLIAHDAKRMVAKTVFLPFSVTMPVHCLEQMAEAIRKECRESVQIDDPAESSDAASQVDQPDRSTVAPSS